MRVRSFRDLRALTAKLDALVVWKEDIQRRIEHAQELFEDGCLYQDHLDALTDAVTAWRLAAAHVVLDLDRDEERRAA